LPLPELLNWRRVFSCDVKGVNPLIRQYGSLININLPVRFQAEMTLSGSTADAGLEVIRSELNQHAVVFSVFQTCSVSSNLACWNIVGEKFLCLETYQELTDCRRRRHKIVYHLWPFSTLKQILPLD